MFDKETYVQRRALLKKNIGSGVLLFLGNDEQGLNYEDNAFRYRQDSTFLYYFGLSFAGLSAIIDIDAICTKPYKKVRRCIIFRLTVPNIS